MTPVTMIESGMTFGPYPPGHCFWIEKSACYQSIRHGVQIAEFLLLRNRQDQAPVIWIVEAKSSSPRPQTRPGFDDFIAEIRDKLSHALMLGVAACLERHAGAETELPEPFKSLDLAKTGFRLVLVINGHRDEWLPPIKDALAQALNPVAKTWALPPTSVVVLNDTLARRHGLIL
jgi:hypothetical protein